MCASIIRLRLPAIAYLFLLLGPCAALFPNPRHLSTGSTPLILAPDFFISSDIGMENGSSLTAPPDLLAAIERTAGYTQSDKHERLVAGRSKADVASLDHADQLAGLELELSTPATVLDVGDETSKAYEDQDESYSLKIPGNCWNDSHRGLMGRITANTTLGLVRGLSTFAQLVYYEREGDTKYILDTPIDIPLDYPAFPHRGFMLDTARNFIPVRDIERTLEAMSWAKLNVFHWHATDSQSWPLFIPAVPRLSQMGAYSAEETYSQKDVARLQKLADSLGISILLEIDMPGHTASIAESYPEYIACRSAPEWRPYSVEPPTGQLKLLDDETQVFVEQIARSAARQVRGKYFSTGGDEINSKCYEYDHETNLTLAQSNATLSEAVSTLIGGVHDVLREESRIPVVWEEMVLDFNVTLKKDTIVMVWISSEHVKEVVEQGYRIIHAPSNYFYLDCGAGGWVGNAPLDSWCTFNSWQQMYAFDPYANLTESEYDQVMGGVLFLQIILSNAHQCVPAGQSLLWTEQTDSTNLDSFAWPRAAVIGEIFWTGANGPDGHPRSAKTALPRLHDWRYRAVQRGVNAIPLQPHYCALRPSACDWQ